MAITAADIEWRYSVKTGSAGNSTAGTAAGSLGKYMSLTEVVFGDLFDDVTGDENASSDVEYRCIFVYNDHATLTYQNSVVWIDSQQAGGTDLAIAIDGLPASPKGQTTAQADEVADEGTAPTGETFTAPTTKATGLSLGNIPAQQCRAIWIRRTANNTGAVNNDGGTIKVAGDTAA